ncbi:MAG: hypothetical protein Q8O48_12310, partial [Anaerolineales bacterium]|nr:hypothetical protein [Anaerolineales bacterium]
DNGAVRITTAKWLTPNEHTIHEFGLTPDVVVIMTEEDYKAKRDPQLDTAMEFLSYTIAGTPYVYEAPPTPSTEPAPTESTPPEPTPTEPVSSVVECPLAMPAHLTSGKSATVINYLYLRSSPGIGNNWLQTMQPNTQVEVMGNPTCVLHGDGAYIWWQVKLPDGAIGWLAEGSFTRKLYFIEPVK